MTMNNRLSSDQKTYRLEADLTKKVKEWLEVQTDICFYKASDRYHKGVSDLILCVRGIFVAIELKAENYSATAHQRLFIGSLIHAGGEGAICSTLGEVKDIVDKARRRAGLLHD